MRSVIASLALLPLLALSGCAKVYWSDPINARVVDVTSGAPVEGVVVMVSWEISGMEGYPQGQLALFEAVTDSDGRFRIPGWGPRLDVALLAVMRGDQPVTRIFKHGYEPLIVDNLVDAPDQDHMRARSHLRPHIDGETLQLIPFSGPPDKDAASVATLWNSLLVPFVLARCDWHLAPMMFRALAEQKRAFDAAGVTSVLQTEEGLCGSRAALPRS